MMDLRLKYCFVFVCQQGELELKACLLAASLKRFLTGHYELVAAVPSPAETWGEPDQVTLSLLRQLKVRVVPIANPINLNYPIGNKLACLSIATDADQIVFLDSDILCLRALDPTSVFTSPFTAKPAEASTFSQGLDPWRQVYRLFDLDLPMERMIATVTGELMPPYFNAGVIGVSRSIELADAWVACSQRIDAESSISNKRPWLDQVALPVALAQLNLNATCLDEDFNYPAHLKPLNQDLPVLCHYHYPNVIRREPRLNQLVKELAADYPELNALLSRYPEWQNLLHPYLLQPNRLNWLRRKHRVSSALPEVMITGIPRSGTSYLCSLLHKVENWVVVNEPRSIFKPLAEQALPWGVAIYYQELRRDILNGISVENKLHEGKLIEDTAIVDAVASYLPAVTRPDFILATKNTLAYLARLSQLKRVMPHATLVACVRHPFDTIASWKATFSHLKTANVADLPVGHVNDPFISGLQRTRLQEIASESSEALKRALLWRYLAEIILEQQDRLLLIHYEKLVVDPHAVLSAILAKTTGASDLKLLEPINPSVVKQKREILDEADYRAIQAICGPLAAELGYQLISKH